jgi:Transposase
MKQRFSDEQIIQMFKQQEAGEKAADLCRCYGISQSTFNNYKSKHGDDLLACYHSCLNTDRHAHGVRE